MPFVEATTYFSSFLIYTKPEYSTWAYIKKKVQLGAISQLYFGGFESEWACIWWAYIMDFLEHKK